MSKTALVTGGTDGIGKMIAIGLARAGCRVLIVGRDTGKGARAESEIRTVTGNANVEFLPADVGVVREARRLTADVIQRCPTLSYLVHSAGVVKGRRELTEEGIEANFAINYLSRFSLTVGLLPLLEASASHRHRSRILFISGAAKNGTIHFDDVNLTTRFGTLRAVLQFCQANDVLTVELADRLAKAGNARVTVSCLKVGVVKTNIRREFPTWMKWLVPLVMDPFLALSPQRVATEALRLLIDLEFEGVTGALFQFIRTFRAIDVPMTVRDPHLRQRLWDFSEQLVIECLTRTVRTSRRVKMSKTPGQRWQFQHDAKDAFSERELPIARPRNPLHCFQLDRAAIERQVRSHIDGWRELLSTTQVQDGRRLLREMLAGPLTFAPEGRTYRFEGNAALGGMLAGIAGVATFLVAVRGIEPRFDG